ncbi:MAG: PTS sugar transporter subunit IIA [Acidobacteria bacterium]|nr:MAG: PTS sugar transporter subunit IIA [Acidobacteriota bacterium]
MRLDELTDPQLIVPRLAATDRHSVLRALAELMAEHGPIDDAEALYDKLEQRESLGSTAIGHGVAVPHCKMSRLARIALAVGITERGVDFGAVDGEPVRLFFLVVSPERQPAAHLKCLAAISRWVMAGDHVERILALQQPHEIHRLLSAVPVGGA